MLPVLVEITADPSLPQAIVRDHYQGTPLLFRLTASPDYPIAGADTLNLELRLVSTDPTAAPLALTALTAPTGPGPYDILFSSAQLNQTLNGRAYADFWLVAYTLTGDQIQIQATVRLHLSAHSASPLLPSPPAPAIALSRIQADLLYATLASHTALATRVTALELVPPGSSAVSSVAGRTGAVTLTQADIGGTALPAAVTASSLTSLGTLSALTVTAPISGSVTGSAASFTGTLTGDVTGTQSATAISAATVTGKALTGYSSAAGTVAATDTILSAINKLNGNDALKANLASPTFTGTVTAPTFSGSLTGNVTGNATGSAASFTGALAGDVTGTQGATAIAATTVTGKALTGFSSSAGTVTAADTILTAIGKLSAATGAATVSPIQTLLDGVGALEIIPVMRHASVVNGERLGLWYSTDECRTFADLYTGDLPIVGIPAGDYPRDPSLLVRNDAWYVAYTAGSFGAVTYWGLAKSTTKGATWTFVQNTTVAESATTGAATWGPSWFVDPATGKTHILISIAPTGYSGYHQPYILTATNTALTAWSAATPLTGVTDLTKSIWDIRITYSGGYYYLVAAYSVADATFSMKILRATSVAGPYAMYKQPAEFTDKTYRMEQCQLAYLGAGRWRLNYTRPTLGLYVVESWDDLATWQTPVMVVDYSLVTVENKHNFSETVKIRSRIADPLPANPGAAASLAASALTGSTLAAGVTASSLTSLGTLASLTVSGATSLANLTTTGQSWAYGTTPGTTTGTTSALGIYTGQLAGTPRVIWANGVLDQNYSLDNLGGTLRWITQDVARMTLTSAGLLTPKALSVSGNTTWASGATFTYATFTETQAHRDALALGNLATLIITNPASATITTYLRGDGTWSTDLAIIAETTTARTLALTDNRGYIRCTHATGTTITVPLQSSVAWVDASTISFRRATGAGAVTLAGVSGVTIAGNTASSVAAEGVFAIIRTGENTWDFV